VSLDKSAEFIAGVRFPVSREELVNKALVDDAPARTVSIFHRLPRESYESAATLRRDVDEISTLDRSEVAGARTFEEMLVIVQRNVGDVDQTPKAIYDRIVDGVIEGAREHGNLVEADINEMHDRLLASYADLRRPMSETYDYKAPRNPRFDLPEKPPNP
jgi:Protein of unknown function (DUF2795)